MTNEIKKVEIIEIKPTHVELRFLPYGNEIKMGTRFFQKKVEGGFYEVINKDKMPSVI